MYRGPIVVVYGPTASGKTARAIEIARERGGEVISTDSRQIYEGFPVTTCKASLEEMQGVPHHLIGILPITEVYSASDFKRDADTLIGEIRERGNVPVVAGGTYFYLEALLWEHTLPDVPADAHVRAELEQRTNQELYDELVECDARRAAALHPNDRVRLIRALEILEVLPAVPERLRGHQRHDVKWVLLTPEREELRDRITTRVWVRLDAMIEEIRSSREHMDADTTQRLGYEFTRTLEHLKGELSREELAHALIARDWQYAKRQNSWARRIHRTVTSQ